MTFKRIEEQMARLRKDCYAKPTFPVDARYTMLQAANTMQALLDVAKAAAEFVRTEQGADFDFITQDAAYISMENALATLREDK